MNLFFSEEKDIKRNPQRVFRIRHKNQYDKLIRMLRHAHAAEHGAWWAYRGHMDSVVSNYEKSRFKIILKEESEHINMIEKMLFDFNTQPSRWQPRFFIIVGKTLGFMCKYTGYRLPMFVAGLMENIGTSSYDKIAKEANKLGQFSIGVILTEMAKTEQEHEEFFKERLRTSR